MKKIVVGTSIVVGFLLATLLLAASPAQAGGWAASSLDEVPTPVAGESIDVGFTIRQHGMTPVNVDEAAVAVRSDSGEQTLFSARQDGPTGHYVARVVFPDAGEFSWQINQGEFGPWDMGGIDVSPPGVASAPSSSPRPVLPRVLLPLLALGGLALVAFDVRGTRRPLRRLAAS